MNNPLVSICIPTYNNEKYLQDCLESIRVQTYKNIEVIFSDNASNDSTLDIIKRYCQQSNWKYVVNDINIGALSNFNKLISLAKGEFVAIYHSDDLYDARIIETCINRFMEQESVYAVGTMANIIDADSNVVSKYTLPTGISLLPDICYDLEDCMRGILSNCKDSASEIHQFFITPSIMVKKYAYDVLGGFSCNSTFGSAADYEMWLRIALKFKVAIVDQTLMSYRIHDDQGSQHEIRQNLNIPDIIYVLREYKKYLNCKELLLKYDNFVNIILFGTALKQNKLNLFAASQATLRQMYGGKYYILKALLTICNIMKITF